MCDLEGGFKLCTCGADQLVDPDWRVERLNEDRPEGIAIGRAFLPPYSQADHDLQSTVLRALNQGMAFDTPFEAREGDVLILCRLSERGHDLRFGYDGTRWVEDRSTALTPWRQQMEHLANGALQLAGDEAIPEELVEAVERTPSGQAREVLLDWAGQHGHRSLERWMRSEATLLDHPAEEPFPESHEQAAASVSRRLRARLARASLDRHDCDVRWEDLARTDEATVRRCTCGREIRFRRPAHLVPTAWR